jgi:serine/threonine protein kinase/WD40 repeat protein
MDSWQTLLAAALTADDQERYERHLESCPACRERLDRIAGPGEPLLRLARRHGDPTLAPADATLAKVVERLQEVKSPVRAADPEAADLYFLRPAERPDLLGTLADYEVQGVIGQGGMGVVLKAFDPALHRLVAIKVLAPALAGSATARRRFTREAQAAAAVCHEHVVAVHGVSDADGLPYLVMQYIAGESLQEKLDRTGPLEVVEVVRIGLQTAQGLAAAHAQGLIHRDVKPANLLLEDGLARVKVTDFGLARTAADAGLTQAGVVAGTPEYMAPEQARGEQVDHRADFFSLGSVLYVCCTGRPPFRGDTPLAVLRRVSEETPTPIRSLNPEVPAWLEALINRLLAKDPAGRFRGAAEVAALLEGYLAHLRQPATVPAPVLPSPPGEQGPALPQPGVQTRAGRRLWLPALLVLAALGLGTALWLTAGAGGVGSTRGERAALDAGVTAPRSREGPPPGTPPASPPSAGERSWLAAGGVLGSLIALSLAGVWLFLRHGRRQGALPDPDDAKGKQPGPEGTSSSISFPCPGCGRTLVGRAGMAGKKAKCPHCGQAALVPGPAAGTSRGARKSRLLLGLAALVLLAAIVAPAAFVLTVFLPGRVPRPGQPPGGRGPSFLNRTLGAEPVSGVEESGFSYQEYDQDRPFRWTDGNARLVVPIDRTNPPQALVVQLVTYRAGKTASLEIRVNDHPLFHDQIPLGRWEKTLDLKGIDLGERLVLDLMSDTFNPLGNRQAGGGVSDDPRILGVMVRGIKLLGREGGVRQPAAPDRAMALRPEQRQGLCCGAFAADGKTLVTGCGDGTVTVWDVPANQERMSFVRLAPALEAVAVSPDGTTFATAGGDRVVSVWDIETGQPRGELPGHTGEVTALAYAPDGRTLASAGGNRLQPGELKLWDLAAGTERVPVEPFKRRLWDVAYAPDGGSVAVAVGDGTAQVVDTGTGKVRMSFSHPSYAHGVAYSRDGKRLAVSYGDEGGIRIYDVDGGKPWSSFQAPQGTYAGRPEFAPDGRRLMAPCIDGTVLVWDLANPQAPTVTALGESGGQVRFAVFFPDGRSVATGDDRTIRVRPLP